MKYSVEMRTYVIIYISSFIKIGSGIQKLTGGIPIRTQRHTDRKVIS
jgi:hypothetical protein